MNEIAWHITNYDKAVNALEEEQQRYDRLGAELWQKGMQKQRRVLKGSSEKHRFRIGLMDCNNAYTCLFSLTKYQSTVLNIMEPVLLRMKQSW